MENKVIDVQNACRICLGLRNLMISLECTLVEGEKDSPHIKDVLKQIFASDVKIFGVYPGNICYVCLELLKNCYQLKQQFLDTENILNTLLDKTEQFITKDSAVEVIFGRNKYNLSDLIIVEEDDVDSKNYKGFLNNLGKTISATFVKKGFEQEAKKIPEQEPDVMIEKMVHLEDNFQGNSNEEIIEDESSVKNITLNTTKLMPDVNEDILKSALNIHLKCNICGKLYSKKWRLLRHLEICGKLIKIEHENIPKMYFSCPYCNKLFKEEKFLNNHISTIHNSVFTCDLCKATFHNKNRYVYHKNTKHRKDFYICQYCGKNFVTKSSLNMHTLSHTHRNKAKCICPICGKTFHYSGGLFYHMKIHTNERKYSCEYCDKRFYTATAQQRHIRTHTGERPYACKFCEKRFFSSSEQRKHQYLHTGNMPYHCQYCRKGFTCKYNLNRHIIKHPGNYKCDICNKGLVTLEVLKIHCDIVHKIKEN